MNLEDIRDKIDDIDDRLKELIDQRMQLVTDVAKYKKANNLPILNAQRELDIINRVTEGQSELQAQYTSQIFTTMFDVSRSYQMMQLEKPSDMFSDLVENTIDIFPSSATVACQGIEGANSQFACQRLFSRPEIKYVNSFEDVFNAVNNGNCEYGILPIENNIHGSVLAVYDLMKKHKCNIVRSVKLKLDHTLLGVDGASVNEIKEVYSHEQALAQCSDFLSNFDDVRIIPCENTAISARMVRDFNDKSKASIATKNCAKLYDLSVVSTDIQNNDNNYTRFICISKQKIIFDGANRISLMFSIQHTPAALNSIISSFAAIGINLNKIESRPLSGTDFEFMFYVDIEANLKQPQVKTLLSSLSSKLDTFEFLGNYYEV